MTGIAVLERTLADIKAAGAISLLDVKRGDIGSTMDAYAAAYLSDGSPLAADAITLSPYLGFGTLDGAIELADRSGRGVYVLALTSNPEGAQVQHARGADRRTVGQLIVDEAAARNARYLQPGASLGPVGIVVGATIGETRHGLRQARWVHPFPRHRSPRWYGCRYRDGLRHGGPLCASVQQPRSDVGRTTTSSIAGCCDTDARRDESSPQVEVSSRASTSWPTRTRPVTIPPLSDEQRQQARHAATEARRRRAEIKQTLRSGERNLAEVLDLARERRRHCPRKGHRRVEGTTAGRRSPGNQGHAEA